MILRQTQSFATLRHSQYIFRAQHGQIRHAGYINSLNTNQITMITEKGAGFATTLHGMDCFFGSFLRIEAEAQQKSKLVSFRIPDLGISFKAQFEGGEDHTDFASLLALLEFIDLNRKLFGNKSLQIFGGNLRIVEQVNTKRAADEDFEPFLSKALKYRQKYHFSLDWTSSDNNPALRTD